MAAPARTELGGATLARKWYLDVNAGTHAAPVWTAVNGLTSFQPSLDPTEKDDSDFSSAGYKSATVTAIGWGVVAKLARKVKSDQPTQYDDGQEILREIAPLTGAANRAEIRFYEMEDDGPREEAYQGYVGVKWSPDGGSNEDLDFVSLTLTGKGQRTAITHPSPTS